jgi:hypothetical protein
MSDPFAEFKQGQPPVEGDPPAAGKPKKPRKKKAAANGKAQVEAPPHTPITKAVKVKKTRKPRAAKEMRLPISILLEIGSLSEEESGALLSIGAGLQKLPKKSRGKICAALAKIFG